MQIFSCQFVYCKWRSSGRVIFCTVAKPRNSGKSSKFTKARKIPQNSVEILSNTCLYNIFETYLSKLVLKLRDWNVQTMSRNYQAKFCWKNWALAMMLKALALVYFWSVWLLKEQMMTSVRKTLKMLVWSAQNRSIFPENNHKIGRFLTICTCFSAKFAPKIPLKLADIFANFSLIIPWNLTFFRDLSEALHSMVRSIRFENIMDRSRYTFGGKLALFMRFGTFSMMKAKQDNMKCLF